jgi:hypothetical protein
MEARRYTEADHATLAQWWAAQSWPTIPETMLPKTGFIVDGICAGFLYRTDSSMTILEWIVANPNSDKIQRRQALDLVIAALLDEAKRGGSSAVFTSCNHKGLLARYEAHGFQVTDTGMTNLIRGL